ncbi:MAG: hypothetical protein M3Y39_20980 [Chloroflexota bacterium]|nr:hypothetical protein [Chloroflexota bacterium]
METKRCAYCHKLQRADAQVCSGCGQPFVSKKSRPSNKEWSQPSIPPASPHRAGHYSGLHPEDQPFQSSKIAIQRPPITENWQAPHQEPERIVLPMVDPESDPGLAPPPSAFAPHMASDESSLEPFIDPPAYMPKRRFLPRRAIAILLTFSCLFFLLASSILAFVLISRSSSPALPVMSASPGQLRINDTLTLAGSGFNARSLLAFTYDINRVVLDSNNHPLQARANAQGVFSVQLRVPNDWNPGQHYIHATDAAHNQSASTAISVQPPSTATPQLQLSVASLNFGADAPGSVTDQTISLVNAGGGQINWQASSDQTWLSVSPGSGTFSGREVVRVKVNRSSLAPQTYSGHITFTPGDSNAASSVILNVTMAVKAAPAVLTLAPTSLNYTMSTQQSSASQTIVLQNSGGQSLNWTSAVATGDGASWLAIAPASGSIAPAQSATVTVSVQAQQLAPGTYQGTITFSGGAHGQVDVALTMNGANGDLTATPSTLAFSMSANQQPDYKAIILQNNGSQTLNWTASATTTNQGSWLRPDVSGGTLAPGAEGFVNARVDATGLQPGTYQGTLTLSAGGAVEEVAITLTVSG